MDTKITCDLCKNRFDPCGEPHDVIYWPTEYPSDKEPLWLCDTCSSGNSVEEIADHFDLPVEHVKEQYGVD
jgi:hypothetical protein